MNLWGNGNVFVTLFLCFTAPAISTRGITVETGSGLIEGSVSLSRLRREFYSWKGIPYAEPPVGALRYADPVPVKPWSSTYSATSYGPFCPQAFGSLVIGKEDCLHLNIFVPKEAYDEGRKLPVMIFIHGGSFELFGAETFGPDYFMDEEVVLVTVNYRLNSFGFLSTGDDVVRGNMGLKDQTMAMKWVKENIRSFGGDPERITIFGESAGAASVHYHMISPLSKGLFHRAICESGTAIAPWALTEDSRNHTAAFAQKLNCHTESSTEMVNCLRQRSVRQIIAAQHKEEIYGSPEVPRKSDFFLPTVEAVDDNQAFITAPPIKYLEESNVSPVPWMAGVNSGEGLLFTIPFLLHRKLREALDSDWNNAAQLPLMLSEREKTRSRAIREFYFGNRSLLNTNNSTVADFVKLTTDRHYLIPLYKATKAHAALAPTFPYYYTKQSPSLYDVLLKVPERLPLVLGILRGFLRNWIDTHILRQSTASQYGVGHGEEVTMLAPFFNLNRIRKHHPDFQFSRDLIKLWVDFASGRDLSFRGVNFPSLKPDDEDPYYLNLDDQPKLVKLRLKDRVELWNAVES